MQIRLTLFHHCATDEFNSRFLNYIYEKNQM